MTIKTVPVYLAIKMRKKRINTCITLIMALYIFSLFPFFTPAKDSFLDLGSAIQQMQNLYQASASDQADFQTALRGSILSLKAIAGMSTVIVKTSKASSTSQNVPLLIVLVKLPHLLSTDTYQPAIDLEFQNSLFPGDQLYTSLNFPPEIPPPVFS